MNTSLRGTLSTGLVLVHIMMNVVNKMSFETKYCQCLEHSFYSLKWYRDDREFFRYIPQGRPQRPQRCTFSKDPKTNYHCSPLSVIQIHRLQNSSREANIYATFLPESPPVTIFLLHGISVSDSSSPTR